METNKEFFEKAGEIFLYALELPEHARAEYYAKQQIASGWEKNVFYTTMRGEYDLYKVKLRLKKSGQESTILSAMTEIERAKANAAGWELNENDIKIDLGKETDGKISVLITMRDIENLNEALNASGTWLNGLKEYSPMQIFSSIEASLRFINTEFKAQTTPTPGWLLRDKKTGKEYVNDDRANYKPHIIDDPDSLPYEEEAINVYHISTVYAIINYEAPFDLERFKMEVRNLMFLTPNIVSLKSTLERYYDMALESLNLWHKELSEIERRKEYKQGKVIKEKEEHIFKFNEREMEIADYNRGQAKILKYYSLARKRNYNFAMFVYSIVDFLGNEVLQVGNKKGNRRQIDKPAPSLDFKDSFKSEQGYEQVMNLLAENDFIDRDSHAWIQKETGYKSQIVALIHHLYHKKYFNFIMMPTPKEIENLLISGFQLKVSERTIKKQVTTDARKAFSFIKQCTE